ncbi:hypothetical protein [Micromonospora rubida]|nr:hypothetical protein [Micromonospora rubida]
MSARPYVLLGAARSAPAASPSRPALIRRRHVDLMRVCSDGCRRHAAR